MDDYLIKGKGILISGSGHWVPVEVISNEELSNSFNSISHEKNASEAPNLERNTRKREYTNSRFIEEASGITHRHVIEKTGILNPSLLKPILKKRNSQCTSYQAEMGISAAKEAIASAGKAIDEVDAVIVGASQLQRAYPSICCVSRPVAQAVST